MCCGKSGIHNSWPGMGWVNEPKHTVGGRFSFHCGNFSWEFIMEGKKGLKTDRMSYRDFLGSIFSQVCVLLHRPGFERSAAQKLKGGHNPFHRVICRGENVMWSQHTIYLHGSTAEIRSHLTGTRLSSPSYFSMYPFFLNAARCILRRYTKRYRM